MVKVKAQRQLLRKSQGLISALLLTINVFWMILAPVKATAAAVTLGLRQAYNQALEANNDIRIAAEDLEQARLLKKQAITVLFPKLTATAGASKQYFEDGTTLDNTTWGLRLNQTLYNGGRVWTAKRGAEISLSAAEYGLNFARQSILLDLLIRTYDVLAAEELLVLVDKRIARVTEQLRSSQAKFEIGQVAKTDVLSARVALTSAKRDRVVAQKDLLLAGKRLAQLLDIEGQVKVKQPPDVELIRFELDEYELKARDNRPDLAQSVELVKFTEQEAKLVKAGGNPDIDLSASYTQYSDQALFVPERQVSLNIEWPFFQGGLVRLQTKEAFSKVRQSQEGHAKRLKAVDLEVEEAFRELVSLEAQKDLVDSSLDNTRENYRLARIQFDLGAGTDLDVLVAQDGLAESENLAVNHKYDMRTARAALLFYIGALDMDVFKFD